MKEKYNIRQEVVKAYFYNPYEWTYLQYKFIAHTGLLPLLQETKSGYGVASLGFGSNPSNENGLDSVLELEKKWERIETQTAAQLIYVDYEDWEDIEPLLRECIEMYKKIQRVHNRKMYWRQIIPFRNKTAPFKELSNGNWKKTRPNELLPENITIKDITYLAPDKEDVKTELIAMSPIWGSIYDMVSLVMENWSKYYHRRQTEYNRAEYSKKISALKAEQSPDRANDWLYKKIFNALESNGWVDGLQEVFVNMCIGYREEPLKPLKWTLRCSKRKNPNLKTLCELLQLLSIPYNEWPELIRLYFGVNVSRSTISKVKKGEHSEWYRQLEKIVNKYKIQ